MLTDVLGEESVGAHRHSFEPSFALFRLFERRGNARPCLDRV